MKNTINKNYENTKKKAKKSAGHDINDQWNDDY